MDDSCGLCKTSRGACHTTEECERRQLIAAVREISVRLVELTKVLQKFMSVYQP